MPELPEIETVKRALAPRLTGRALISSRARRSGLRHPFPDLSALHGQIVREVRRRSKYLLLDFDQGTLLLHLGMSGHLRWMEQDQPAGKHDHLDLIFEHGLLRLNDPRRFGAAMWQSRGEDHPALASLGPEPLDTSFDAKALHLRLRGRKTPIKVALMDPRVVVGVGNIYATEALFRSRIDPRKPAGELTLAQARKLLGHVKDVLNEGIARGGSTLRDFHGIEGQAGTFVDTFQAYGRQGLPCPRCNTPIQTVRLGGRASAFCPRCQG